MEQRVTEDHPSEHGAPIEKPGTPKLIIFVLALNLFALASPWLAQREANREFEYAAIAAYYFWLGLGVVSDIAGIIIAIAIARTEPMSPFSKCVLGLSLASPILFYVAMVLASP